MTQAERKAVEALYINPRTGRRYYDAFSHSKQCDENAGNPAVTHPGTGRLLPGFEQEHIADGCWCHTPDFDLDSPPEYVTEPPAFEPVAVSLSEREQYAADAEVAAADARSEYQGREPEIFSSAPDDPDCELCGDPMSLCECVEFIDDKPVTAREKARLLNGNQS